MRGQQMVENVHLKRNENISVRELMTWVSDELGIPARDLSDFRSGAIYCQILNRLFPKCIPISKVLLKADAQRHCEFNLTLLASCFRELRIDNELNISELAKGNGHFDFLKWMYKFYKKNIKLSDSDNSENSNRTLVEEPLPRPVKIKNSKSNLPKPGTSVSSCELSTCSSSDFNLRERSEKMENLRNILLEHRENARRILVEFQKGHAYEQFHKQNGDGNEEMNLMKMRKVLLDTKIKCSSYIMTLLMDISNIIDHH